MQLTDHRHRPLPVRRLVAAAAGTLLLAACGTSGSGDIVTVTRSVADFERIDVSDGVDVVLVVDPAAEQEVVVEFDDNLLDQVVTTVEGDTLVVGLDGSVRLFGGGRFVKITVDEIRSIATSGGADVTGAGEAGVLSIDASGGSDVNLRELEATSVEVDASGGADVALFAGEAVTGSASGGADVSVYGNPTTVDVATSGGANVDVVS